LNITIKNNTTLRLDSGSAKPSTSTDWGSSSYPYIYIGSGESKTITLPKPLSASNVYDFRFFAFDGSTFIKFNITVTNGMTVTLTNSDLQ